MSMHLVCQHYDQHLGPVYAWMVGGIDAAFERGTAELDAIGARPSNGGIVVDLGAGFGMHAIPLARQGFDVVALDSSARHARRVVPPGERVDDPGDLR